MYQVLVTLTDETAGHIFTEFVERADGETPGEVYRAYQHECGVCRSRVYVDTPSGARPVGWYFESRQHYEDTNEPYIRGAWVTYQEIPDRPEDA